MLVCACRGQDGKWLLAEGARGTCPSGTMFELPRQAKENTALQHALQQAALLQAWLPMQGAHAPLYAFLWLQGAVW